MFSLHIDTARTWRGGQQQTLLTVLGLRERGHRTVLVAHPQGELHARASEGVDLVGLAPRNEIDLAAAWKLSRVLRQYSPKVVHAHDPHAVALAGTALSFGALTPAPPLVASRRVDFHLSGNSFSRWKYRQVARFIAASAAIRDILEEDGIAAADVAIVHDGIDVGRVQRLPELDLHVEFWLPRGVPVIVNVGALVGHKGQKHLLDAMPLVWERMPEVELTIAGTGDIEAHPVLDDPRVRVRNEHVPDAELPAIFAAATCCVLPYRQASQSGVGSHAKTYGRAIVASDVGGLPELVGPDGGRTVPPGDPAALAAALIDVVATPGLAASMSAAAARSCEESTWRRVGERSLAAYERYLRPDGVGQSA